MLSDLKEDPNKITPDPFYLERAGNSLPANDLQSTVAPITKFGNFSVPSTGGNAYLMDENNVFCQFNIETGLTTSNRSFQLYCPNADKLLYTSQITNNVIAVCTVNNSTQVVDIDGIIDRTAYKATNESGANGMIYSPFSEMFYVQANNNSNVTGVDLVHYYDPTLAVASMYQGSITVGEMKSASRASTAALNTMCMNRVPQWEYPDRML